MNEGTDEGSFESLTYPYCAEARRIVRLHPNESRRWRIAEAVHAGIASIPRTATFFQEVYQRCLFAMPENDRALTADLLSHVSSMIEAGDLPAESLGARQKHVTLPVSWGKVRGVADWAWTAATPEGATVAHVARIYPLGASYPDPAGVGLALAWADECKLSAWRLTRVWGARVESVGGAISGPALAEISHRAKLEGGPTVTAGCASCEMRRKCSAWPVMDRDVLEKIRQHTQERRSLHSTEATEAEVIESLRHMTTLRDFADRIEGRARAEVQRAGRPLRDGKRWEWGQFDGKWAWREVRFR